MKRVKEDRIRIGFGLLGSYYLSFVCFCYDSMFGYYVVVACFILCLVAGKTWGESLKKLNLWVLWGENHKLFRNPIEISGLIFSFCSNFVGMVMWFVWLAPVVLINDLFVCKESSWKNIVF